LVSQENSYNSYYKKVEKETKIVPNVKGMEGMDAVALLENLGLKVKVIGIGRVKKQSLTSGQAFNKNQTIIIELS
jgi:cell division protein FtsI (penicillin-binding protein 3)